MIARLDEKLSAQMNEILHAPEFQKIESSWRGPALPGLQLGDGCEPEDPGDERLEEGALRNLRLYPGARWDQSPIFKQVYEHEFGQLGGEPYGCLIGDYYFSHLPTDVQLMRDMARSPTRRTRPSSPPPIRR